MQEIHARMESIEVYSRLVIRPFCTILLLMGMCVTITGYILKSRWLVWCGIIGGLGGFIWESFYVTDTLLARFSSPISYNHIQHLVPGMMIAVFAFVGLTLPGMSRISHHDKTMKCHGKVLKCHEKVLKCHPKEYERPSYS